MQNIRNFCIIAHINHGKSTLADRFLELTGTVEKRKMHEQFLDRMELERERGITIKLQPVRMIYKIRNPKSEILNKSQIQNSNSPNSLGFRDSNLGFSGSEYILNLIDTPGHVDFSYEVSRSLAAVEGAILLVDATKGVQAQTLANLHLAQKQGLVIIPAINKIDLPNARIAEVEEEIKKLLRVDGNILKISAKTGEGIPEVLETVIKRIPAPQITNYQLLITNASRALIFDSAFDAYKGVIAYVRVFDGEIKVGDKIKLFASKAGGEAVEVGHFMPELKKYAKLSAGDIGYIATGLKNPGQVRVGDTIYKNKNVNIKVAYSAEAAISAAKAGQNGGGEEIEPLPGYEEPRPVVFASFYPESSDDYNVLKDALGKLKLTDASLSYEPETSVGLGRGFRLGFLGMLHVEIVSERLKREFGLPLVISTPSVEYRVVKKYGGILAVRSATVLPDPGIIEKIEEPMVELEILTPEGYLGQLLKLMTEYRSEYNTTEYITKELVILKYRVPLAEIITDFYDRLKSVSSGYASMSYEPAGYQTSDLIRLDILVGGEPVEPFSKIVPRASAYQEGRRMVEKLKKVIPRQWFAVSLQAAIGGSPRSGGAGKIIARETISALRKDVTGYLYGGDVTRKKKLLEKQKKGKKKMKELGRVNIPQRVFLEMLKR